jgi:hypothetical protein
MSRATPLTRDDQVLRCQVSPATADRMDWTDQVAATGDSDVEELLFAA